MAVDLVKVIQPVPLPTGAATQTTLAALLTELTQKTEPTDTQPVSGTVTSNLAWPADVTQTDTITGHPQNVVFAVPVGATSITFVTTGSYTGVVTPEQSHDAQGTWVTSLFLISPNSAAVSFTVASNGTFTWLRPAGATHIRLRTTSWTSGTMTINWRAQYNALPGAIVSQVASGSAIRIEGNAIGTNISQTANALHGILRDAAGNARGANVNASNQLSVSVDNTPTVNQGTAGATAWPTSSPGTVSTNNSSTALLGIDAVFTGLSDDVKNASAITVNVFADKDSAAGGLSLQWSANDIHWDITEAYDVTANDGRSIQASVRMRYFRVVYTNGGVAQGAFRLQTILRDNAVQDRRFPINNSIRADEAAALVRAVITGVTTAGGGAYINVKVSPSGAVQIGGDIDSIVNPLPQRELTAAGGQVSTPGNNTLITPASGKRVRVYYVSYNPLYANECAFRFGVAGPLLLRNNVVAGSVITKDFGDLRYIQGAVNEVLILNLSLAVVTNWTVFYIEV